MKNALQFHFFLFIVPC